METENIMLLQLFFPALLKIMSKFGYHYIRNYFGDEGINALFFNIT
jgi:hypothetical protein